MTTLSILAALAAAAVVQTGDDTPRPVGSYDAVMQAQYAAHSETVAQRPEEAWRIYDAYLDSIGQKIKRKSDTSLANGGDPPR